MQSSWSTLTNISLQSRSQREQSLQIPQDAEKAPQSQSVCIKTSHSVTFDLQRESAGFLWRHREESFKQTSSAAGFLRHCSYLALTHHQISGMNTPTRFCLCATDLQQQVLHDQPERTTRRCSVTFYGHVQAPRPSARFTLFHSCLFDCFCPRSPRVRETPTPLQSAAEHCRALQSAAERGAAQREKHQLH